MRLGAEYRDVVEIRYALQELFDRANASHAIADDNELGTLKGNASVHARRRAAPRRALRPLWGQRSREAASVGVVIMRLLRELVGGTGTQAPPYDNGDSADLRPARRDRAAAASR